MLKFLTEVNKTFQAENANPLKLLEDLYSLLYYYMRFLIPPARLEVKKIDLAHFKFRDYIMRVENIDFGYSFEQAASGLNHHELKVIKERCRLLDLFVRAAAVQNPRQYRITGKNKLAFATTSNITDKTKDY